MRDNIPTPTWSSCLLETRGTVNPYPANKIVCGFFHSIALFSVPLFLLIATQITKRADMQRDEMTQTALFVLLCHWRVQFKKLIEREIGVLQ